MDLKRRDYTMNVVEIRGKNDDGLFDFFRVGQDGSLYMRSQTSTPNALLDTTAAAYASGDCLGTVRTLSSAIDTAYHTGLIESISVVDTNNKKPAMDIIVFSSTPSAGTYVDNATPSFSTDAAGKIIRKIPIYASDYTTENDIAVADIAPSARTVVSDTTSLYFLPVATAATTFTAATPVTVRFNIIQD
jgi:hypothetical protein